MNLIKETTAWLFKTQFSPISWWRVILWWEIRRIPFNLLIGIYGVFSLVIFYWSIMTSGHLQFGEDAVEPLALIVAPVVVNICYTMGWLLELSIRAMLPSLPSEFGPCLLRFGIGFSLFVISIPALFWGGYRLLQLFYVLLGVR